MRAFANLARATRDVMLVLTALLSVVVVVAAINFSIGLRKLEEGNDALRVSEGQSDRRQPGEDGIPVRDVARIAYAAHQHPWFPPN